MASPWRVLDLSMSLGGSYATRLLSAAGADVTRVEPPEGHWLRRWSASGAPIADDDSGALFRWLTGGQHSVTVDRADDADLAALGRWAGSFDAVVWSRDALLPFAPLRAAAPDAVLTAVTPFGLTGPWADRAATEFTLQALSGAPGLRGSRAWPPVSAGGQLGEYTTGVVAAVATLIGLRHRTRTGRGGVLDVSALEATIMTQLFNPITLQTMETGVRARRSKATVADVVATEDGYVGFAVVNRLQHWLDFCALIGHDEWAADRSLDIPWNRSERCDELNPVIQAWCAARTTAEIVEIASLMRIPCIEVGHGASIPQMDHFAEAGFYDRNPGGGFLQPAPPFRLHPNVPGVGECQPSPVTGPPIRTVEPPTRAARSSGPIAAPDALPFAGLRVADFTSFWAGPFLTHVLAMFGADVIHVESTARPDGARLMCHRPPTVPGWWEWSSFFQATNTNKRDVTIDMNGAEGRALARRLVAECDVVVENYSPRVMESWGLGWDDVHALRPDAVMVRMPAFGLSGPWRDRTGFAMTMEQVSGLAWLTGFPEYAPGALFGPCDPGAGLHAAVGLLSALAWREQTGEGVLVEAPMVAGALNMAGEQVIEHSAYGVLLERDGNRGPAASPQNCYRCADVDAVSELPRWVAVAAARDDQRDALRGALGCPSAEVDLDAALGAWCATRSSVEVVERLTAAGVPVAAVVHPSEQLEFEQLHHRRFFETVHHPVSGDSVHVTFPFRLEGTGGPMHRHPAPTLGQHNDEVLTELLGLSMEEVNGLRERGVIGETLAG